MMLGRVLMMHCGMLVVLVNLVIVHGSLSGVSGRLKHCGIRLTFFDAAVADRCHRRATRRGRRVHSVDVLSYRLHDAAPIAKTIQSRRLPSLDASKLVQECDHEGRAQRIAAAEGENRTRPFAAGEKNQCQLPVRHVEQSDEKADGY
jgi:hypothetical protein